MRRLWSQRGDTLVEVVFAIAILSSVLTTAYRMSSESLSLGIDSREHIQAINVAQLQAEELRWYAAQQMATGTSLLASGGTWGSGSTDLLSSCTFASICHMVSITNPFPAGGSSYDCTSSVTTGCSAEIKSINDIKTDALGHTYPEINEEIIVKWPSKVQNSQTSSCPDAVVGYESVCVDVRLADTTNYAPLDCSVAGTPGCSPGAGGNDTAPAAPQCPSGEVGSPPICLGYVSEPSHLAFARSRLLGSVFADPSSLLESVVHLALSTGDGGGR